MAARLFQPRFFTAGHGLAVLILLWVLQSGSAIAQTPAFGPLTPPDTSSPRATLQNFQQSVDQATAILMDAYREFQAEPGFFRSPAVKAKVARAEALLARAARSLDLSDIPPVNRSNRALEATLLLKEILDRSPMPASTTIPGPEAVGSDARVLQGWTIPGTEIRIVRMSSGPRAGDYLFSGETVQRLDEFYDGVKGLPDLHGREDFYAFYTQSPGHLLPPKWYPAIEALPDVLRERVAGQAIWQWAGLMLLAVLLKAWLLAALHSLRRVRGDTTFPILVRAIAPPGLTVLTAWAFLYVADFHINITGRIEAGLNDILEGVSFLALVWGVVALSNALAQIAEQSPRLRPESIDASLTRAAIRTMGIAVACCILVYGASHLGLPLAGILAGLGVGGLAIALAAKPTIENFIGGLILFADRPVRVGDMCRFGDLQGQVEGIGIRSTRIRGLDRTLITVPNSVFVNLNLINLSNRDGMPFNRTVKIRAPGDSDAIRKQIAAIVSTVASHPQVDPTSVRVRLHEGAEEEPKVELRAVVTTRNWNEFLAIQQDLDLVLRDNLRKGPAKPDDPAAATNVYRLDSEVGAG
ncbi:mechanosensitive ion channel family protein [Microvirga pudoricolor]|uniref:mechanosensitive ion channel family protein n=1 Tax=Microvirga pudoricolor TaxID=2778729 RepID=UPI00194DC623|nr:mechanosensitive ion channel family protein [Microvirga pudoricolor]MBM6594285.1 mechanosensitive ion channel family protein [Microvirga pudoricolor]